jgi:hypothetical protein
MSVNFSALDVQFVSTLPDFVLKRFPQHCLEFVFSAVPVSSSVFILEHLTYIQ